MTARRGWAGEGVLVLLVAAIIVITGVSLYVSRLQGQIRTLALKSYNDSALLDSTRHVNALLGAGIQAVTRLAVQRTQERDALDQSLKVERKATVALRAAIDSLTVRGAVGAGVTVVRANSVGTASAGQLGVTRSDSGLLGQASSAGTAPDSLRDTWQIRQAPYSVHATATLPISGRGVLDFAVTLDAADITVRLGCQAKNADGIRAARVVATMPNWLQATVLTASQDADVCNQSAERRGFFGFFRPSISVGPGLSATLAPDRSVHVAPSVNVTLSVWHWPRSP